LVFLVFSMAPPTRLLAYSYIRISSDMQLRGDSLRRQLESSRKYAVEKGLELVEDMRDLGISGFTGANVAAEGALGKFLDAVRSGKVPAGSSLIVESLDRLSRQQVRKSLSLFLEIINSGVTIHTLLDGRVYAPEDTELMELMMSIMILSRAHEESKTKSIRIGQAWEKKRKHAATRPLTARCPPWLKLKRDRSVFEVIEPKAAIIRRVFDESAAGIGAYRILQRLNCEKAPHLSGTDGWTSSYVCKLLKNRAVLGEYQPFKYVKKANIWDPRRRKPDGDPVSGYFPAIIPENVFDMVQAGLKSRRGRGGRKGGKFLRNIFSGLARCEYCQSPMKFEHRGAGGYLVCDHGKRGVECTRAAWRYPHFELSFLSFVKEFDLVAVIDGEAEVSRRRTMENQVIALRGKLASVEDQRDRTYELFLGSGKTSDFIGKKVTELDVKCAELKIAVKAKSEELADLEHDRIAAQDIRPLIEMMQTQDGDEKVYKLRSQVASRLRSLIKVIYVAPLGTAPLIDRLTKYVGNVPGSLVEQFKLMSHDERHFVVLFENESSRWVFPSKNDPFKISHQVVGDADAARWLDPSGKVIQMLKMRRHDASGGADET
jgi:DNA invertase Pin-like site-specific DNA recombinase